MSGWKEDRVVVAPSPSARPPTTSCFLLFDQYYSVHTLCKLESDLLREQTMRARVTQRPSPLPTTTLLPSASSLQSCLGLRERSQGQFSLSSRLRLTPRTAKLAWARDPAGARAPYGRPSTASMLSHPQIKSWRPEQSLGAAHLSFWTWMCRRLGLTSRFPPSSPLPASPPALPAYLAQIRRRLRAGGRSSSPKQYRPRCTSLASLLVDDGLALLRAAQHCSGRLFALVPSSL